MKSTAEEWKAAWEKVESYVKHNAYHAFYVSRLGGMMEKWRPKEETCEPEPTSEPLYTLSEIVALAEPGDEFGSKDERGPWTIRDEGVVRVTCGTHMAVRKDRMRGPIWFFTKRAKCCPHCGKVMEE
jgi:hypothetical protein